MQVVLHIFSGFLPHAKKSSTRRLLKSCGIIIRKQLRFSAQWVQRQLVWFIYKLQYTDPCTNRFCITHIGGHQVHYFWPLVPTSTFAHLKVKPLWTRPLSACITAVCTANLWKGFAELLASFVEAFRADSHMWLTYLLLWEASHGG